MNLATFATLSGNLSISFSSTALSRMAFSSSIPLIPWAAARPRNSLSRRSGSILISESTKA